MKSSPVSWLAALLMLASAAFAADPQRVLFIGNSYTGVNKLPEVFLEVVKSSGRSAPVVKSSTPGGRTLKQHLGIVGSLALIYAVSLLFIAANLAMGITFSTLAKNQLQAVQMAFFFFLPSILLSGFMFPFRGMPEWAQWVGSILPNTHFLRIVRCILLKGNGLADIAPALWPLLAFLVVAMAVGVKRYRQTLD